jgi:hypothetical protein
VARTRDFRNAGTRGPLSTRAGIDLKGTSMLKRLILAGALAVGFAAAAAAVPSPVPSVPDEVAVAWMKHGQGHHGWRGRGRGHHYGWYKHRRHHGWSRGRHHGWR